MAEYTLTLNSNSDYRMIKKLLKAFEGASIRPVSKRRSGLEIAFEEVKKGEVSGPYFSTADLMKDLLD